MAEFRITIVGRINVGKSTLFNRLTRTRDAIVENTPGVTRDRKEGHFQIYDKSVILIDTGGIDAEEIDSKPADEAQKHSLLAMEDSDLLLFVVDGRAGLLPGDQEIAEYIRRTGKPVILVANKVDSVFQNVEFADFFKLGFDEPVLISAEHNENIDDLFELLNKKIELIGHSSGDIVEEQKETRIAVVGRPNVGKSSFLNAIIGENRHIVTDVPGTTRDAVDSLFTFQGNNYRLIDTAGLKRIGKTKGRLDKVTAIMARRSIERSHIALLLFDSVEGVTAQDIKIASYILDAGKAVIIIANKWDLTSRDTEKYKTIQQMVRDKYVAMPWAPFMVMSALEGHNTHKVLSKIDEVMNNAKTTISTSRLNKLMRDAQIIHPPPRRDARHHIKLYYATQINQYPPTFLIFTNTRYEIHFSYRRFLMNQIRDVFKFEGWPIRLVFRHRNEERGKRWD